MGFPVRRLYATLNELEVDIAVVGAGVGGFTAAMRAFDLNRSVAIINRGRVGGASLHDGALSSKTLWVANPGLASLYHF